MIFVAPSLRPAATWSRPPRWCVNGSGTGGAVDRTACWVVASLAAVVQGSFVLAVGDVVLAVDAVGADGE